MHKFTFISLFFATFISRILFKWISGYDNFELFGDSVRYDILSERILNGNHNLDFTAFVISPLYPYSLALFKWLCGDGWLSGVTIFQFLLISFSTVFLAKIALILFDKKVAILSGIIYILYPFTLYYNFTFTQETTFQAYFIIAIYFLLKYLKQSSLNGLIISAIFFSLSFLTKSHVLLYAPFIAMLIIFFNDIRKRFSTKFKDLVLYGFICLFLTIPGGLINLKYHNIYSLSGIGFKTFFHNGNSQQNYDFIFYNVGIDSDKDMAYIFDTIYIDKTYGAINKLPHNVKQDLHFKLAKNWIKEHPMQFFKLKLYSFIRFFTPGVSLSKYNTFIGFSSLIISIPIFILTYYSIYLNLKTNFRKHAWILFLQISMLIFYIIFMPQTRFRVITLEPYYLIYFAAFMTPILQKLTQNYKLAKSFFKK